jgi:hypothetical protein
MKFISLFTASILLALQVTLSSCSEKSRAAAKAIHARAEDQLVAVAGEGEVALELMKNQYSEIKERLVKVKTLKRTMERRVEQAESTAKRLDAEGNGSMADRQRELARRHKTNLEKLRLYEIKSEEALKSFSADYKEFKMEVSILKEEIEIAKTMGGISDDLNVNSPLNTRMETVIDLKGKLQAQLDRANSLMEVNEFEADL